MPAELALYKGVLDQTSVSNTRHPT
ncbi:uncharacterized protein METZ01_LOCUS184221, partial [marine metagenome]